MAISRRGFFGALAGLGATAQADPERLLRTPRCYVQGVLIYSRMDGVSDLQAGRGYFSDLYATEHVARIAS